MNIKRKIEYEITVISVAVLIFILVISIALAGSKSPSESIEDIIKVAERGDRMVWSGKGTIISTLEIDSAHLKEMNKIYDKEKSKRDRKFLKKRGRLPTTELQIREKTEMSFAFNDIKLRRDRKNYVRRYPDGEKSLLFESHIYDGTYLYSCEGSSSKPEIEYIKVEKEFEFTKFQFFGGLAIQGTPVASFLKGNYQNRQLNNFRLIGVETQDGLMCKVFQGEYKSTFKDINNNDITDNHIITVWIAKDRMYRPKHIEDISYNVRKGVHHYSFKDYNGIWIPVTEVSETYQFDKSSNKWIQLSKDTQQIQSDFEVNIDLPDSLFTVPTSQVIK